MTDQDPEEAQWAVSQCHELTERIKQIGPKDEQRLIIFINAITGAYINCVRDIKAVVAVLDEWERMAGEGSLSYKVRAALGPSWRRIDYLAESDAVPLYRIHPYNEGGPFRIFTAGRHDAVAVCEHEGDAQRVLNALLSYDQAGQINRPPGPVTATPPGEFVECDDASAVWSGETIHCRRRLGHRGPHSVDREPTPDSLSWRDLAATPKEAGE